MIQFTTHAEKEMVRRGIPRLLAEAVLASPEQRVHDEGTVWVYQSRVDLGKDKPYLLRIFVAEDEPKQVVTLYLTSKLNKYWEQT